MTVRKTTSINRTWLVKMLIFTLVLLAFGSWGLYDALWVYPANGRLAASHALKNYLDAARDANRLTPAGVKIDNPSAELADLGAKQRAARSSKSGGVALTPLESARLEFLQSLSRAWLLSSRAVKVGQIQKDKTTVGGAPVYSGVGGVIDARKQLLTQFFDPQSGEAMYKAFDGSKVAATPDVLQKDLNTRWQGKTPPAALAAYDLPSQWIFVIVGYGAALYLIFLVLRVIPKRYSYEPEEKRLILPGGAAFIPADVKEFDKRKWHKFFVTINLRDGRAFRLDLLRYVPLEDWVLEMERAAFPNEGGDEETKDESIQIPSPDDDDPRLQAATTTPV